MLQKERTMLWVLLLLTVLLSGCTATIEIPEDKTSVIQAVYVQKYDGSVVEATYSKDNPGKYITDNVLDITSASSGFVTNGAICWVPYNEKDEALSNNSNATYQVIDNHPNYPWQVPDSLPKDAKLLDISCKDELVEGFTKYTASIEVLDENGQRVDRYTHVYVCTEDSNKINFTPPMGPFPIRQGDVFGVSENGLISFDIYAKENANLYLYHGEKLDKNKFATVPIKVVLSNNADLNGLSLSTGSLTPTFSNETTNYQANVPYAAANITVTPVAADASATIQVNGTTVDSGQASGPINLEVGENTVKVDVTAENGTTKTYTVTVTRATAPSNNSSGGGGGQTVPVEKDTIISDTVKTTHDKALETSLRETGEAVLRLSNNDPHTANLSVSVVDTLARENKSLTIENKGVKVQFPPQALLTEELVQALAEPNSQLEIGAREIPARERETLLANTPLGESSGLFTIGGKVVDLAAEVLIKGEREKISSFPEPVAVTLDLLSLGELSPEQIAELTAVRFEKDAAGKITPVRLGGTYNAASKTFIFYTDKFSLYGVLRASKLAKVTLTLNSPVSSINGQDKNLDVPPTMINNRTMVPVRFVCEGLGADVKWLAETSTALIKLDGQEVRLTLGETGPGLDVPATVVNGRTLVPIRYVSECLGANVKWFPSKQMVEIVR